jgi:peptidoglycan/xylan/chitin deacetylase (PgdA/CDA1 family)
VTIGAHTLSHPMLPNMPTELAYAEIADSRTQIERVIGEPVWAFAYPFGDRESVGDREADLAQSAGFECAFTNTEANGVTRTLGSTDTRFIGDNCSGTRGSRQRLLWAYASLAVSAGAKEPCIADAFRGI